jgi:hypothetical protein
MTTKYIVGCDPYKKISWFKKLLIWLKLTKNPNQSFTILLSEDNFNTGEILFNGKENLYIHSKKDYHPGLTLVDKEPKHLKFSGGYNKSPLAK